LLELLQTRATLPRVAFIVGKNNRSYMKEFVGDDIRSINRAVVELGNAVSRTVAGRLQMGQDLLQQGAIDARGYMQVVATGKTEIATGPKEREELLIHRENEDLREGREVLVTAVDLHLEHITGHRDVFSDPDARRDPNVMNAALAHIQQHIDALRTTDPYLLNLLGQPINAQPQGAAAPQPPGNQPQDGAPQNQAPAPPNASPEIAGNMPNLPSPPAGAPEVPTNTPA
jgi:hypothetical protein